MLISWMDALDALPPKTAYAAATPPASEPAPTNGEHATTVTAEPTTTQRDGASPPTLSTGDDVAALRDGLVMQPQPKRGFFRRK
jgi:hypothetical protein